MDQSPDTDGSDPFELGSDPGWRPGDRDGRPDGLVALRFVFVLICGALLTVGVIVAAMAGQVDRTGRPVSAWAAAAAIVVVGGLGLAGVRAAPVRLDCADELTLARSWRTRFFARAAAAELPALAGFIGFSLTGAPALYPLGLTFTAVGLAYAGPLRATLIRDQEQLALQGCTIALVSALRRAVTRDTR